MEKNDVAQKAAVRPKKPRAPVQVPDKNKETDGPEIWDGNNDGWTKIAYRKRQKK